MADKCVDHADIPDCIATGADVCDRSGRDLTVSELQAMLEPHCSPHCYQWQLSRLVIVKRTKKEL